MTTQKELMKKTADQVNWEISLHKRGLTAETFRVLKETVWPDAEDRTVLLAADYCRARNLDPFKKPVHIVPVYSKKQKKMVDTIWPGISEYRVTANRTGNYAGRDETVFGPSVTEDLGGVTITYPEWAQVTVYRIVHGVRCAFVGPKVIWKETYSKAGRDTAKPNAMWTQRPVGQIDKCAEAASLRAAFPEEIGGTNTAEEMAGKEVEAVDGEWSELAEPEPDAPEVPEEEKTETPKEPEEVPEPAAKK